MGKKRTVISLAIFILSVTGFLAVAIKVWGLNEKGFYDKSLFSLVESYTQDTLEQYSIHVMYRYKNGGNYAYSDLKDTNFKYGVIHADSIERLDLTDMSIYEVQNFDEGFDTDKLTIYSYNVDDDTIINSDLSMWGNSVLYNENATEYVSVYAEGYVYDSNSNDGEYTELYAYADSYLFDMGNFSIDEIKSYYPSATDGNPSYYGILYDSEWESDGSYISYQKQKNFSGKTWYVVSYVADPLDGSSDDLFTEGYNYIYTWYNGRYGLLVALTALFVTGAISLVCTMRALGKAFASVWNTRPAEGIVWFIIYAGVAAFELIVLLTYVNYPEVIEVLWLLEKIIIFIPFIIFAMQITALKKHTKKIAEGSSYEIMATNRMFPDIKEIAENVNNISEGLDIAVSERLKSERLRTELITNVSHDIKTPLTSIISYVDLLSKEEMVSEKAKEYLEVLDRQSDKLKTLIDDLVEASKASSGALPVELEPGDVAIMIEQLTGEYEDRLKEKEITLITDIPGGAPEAMFDPRHLQRTVDNLMINISKYTQNGTRAYINVVPGEKFVDVIFKNISREELNVSPDELLERFTRADESRNSDGFGLGLAIASSLMKLMGGELLLEIDGDLFKATIRLKKA